MSRLEQITHEVRVIDDWATELAVAARFGDIEFAATAAATITAAAQAISDKLDPKGKVTPAITLVDGQYRDPNGEVKP